MGAKLRGAPPFTHCQPLTFTATCSLAVFLEGPEASKELPSTSTDMVKMGRALDQSGRSVCTAALV